MEDLKMPHKGHETHLCYLKNMGLLTENLQLYKKLVKDSQFICKNCGRAGNNEKNLCNPEKL